MPGKVARKYNAELIEICKKTYKEVKAMSVVLPQKFTIYDIVDNYKKYYPYQYFWWNDMNKTYIQKNKFLASLKKRERYMEFGSFKDFLLSIPGIKSLLTRSKKGELIEHTDEKKIAFIENRNIKISKKEKAIQDYKFDLLNGEDPFELDPLYLEQLIRHYHKSNIVTKERIVDDLMKYTGELTVQFFKKLNDCENNKDIREKAFYHLQRLGYYVKLRKNPSKGKKSYAKERFDTSEETFDDLFYFMNQSNSFERKKQFHFFISHNKSDKNYANEIKKQLNAKGLNCYYCWISDSKDGYSEHLSDILELRIKQSKAIIKVASKNHDDSEWCQFEIERAIANNKIIHTYEVGEDIGQFVEKITR